jgi:hypothetical protein
MFDLTGTTLYRTMRPVLPPSPPRDDQDPFSAAMSTIMAAQPDAVRSAREESGETSLACLTPTESKSPARQTQSLGLTR